MSRVTVEFEDGSQRTFTGALVSESYFEGAWSLNVTTHDPSTRRGETHTFPIRDVAAWTTEPE